MSKIVSWDEALEEYMEEMWQFVKNDKSDTGIFKSKVLVYCSYCHRHNYGSGDSRGNCIACGAPLE